MNFFVALFLAGNMEEDLPFRENIYPWALGMMWRHLRTYFHHIRRILWARMDFQARVTREECEQIMSENPNHWAWQRQRKEHHGWAIRNHARNKEEFLLLVPGFPPPLCFLCRANAMEHQPSEWKEVTSSTILASAASPEDGNSDIDVVN
ncbi:speedy protein 1-A-like [Rhinophrynus dorsalis]